MAVIMPLPMTFEPEIACTDPYIARRGGGIKGYLAIVVRKAEVRQPAADLLAERERLEKCETHVGRHQLKIDGRGRWRRGRR